MSRSSARPSTEAHADRPRTTTSVREALDVLSSHPRHAGRRAWIFMLAMFVPTIAIGGLLLLFLIRSFDPADLSGWRDRAVLSLRTLLAVTAFFAAFGATALISLRLSRLRSLSDGAAASGRLVMAALAGIVLSAVVPTIVLDLAENPWLRLAAHLAAPLAFALLLAAIEIGEREEYGERQSGVSTICRWLEILVLTFGVVMLSDVAIRLLRVPAPENWPYLRPAIPADLSENWRSAIGRLVVLEAAIILAGLLWMFRHWWERRRIEQFEPEPDWPDRLVERLAAMRRSDGEPLFEDPPKWSADSGTAVGDRDSKRDRFDCLFPSGRATSDQSRAIEALHRDYADAIRRADEQTDIESGLESANAILLGDPGGGIDETLAAACVVARLRGHRIMVIAPSEHRLDLLASRIRMALATLAMEVAVEIAKLSARDLRERLRSDDEAKRASLPSIVLATRRSFDTFVGEYAIGDRESDDDAALNPAAEFLAECETVLVDRMEMFLPEDRFAIPFMLSLLRTLVRTRGGIEQFVVGLGLESSPSRDEEPASERRMIDAPDPGTSLDAAVTTLWERLFGESQSRPPRICRLRHLPLPSLRPLEIAVPDADVARVQESIESYLKEQRIWTAVWPDEQGHGAGATALKRWVPLRSIRDIPRFDARRRECLLVRSFDIEVADPLDESQREERERLIAERTHELSALEGWFGGDRHQDDPLWFIRVVAESSKTPRDRGRVRPPVHLVLPERDDALRGLPYLVSAALLLRREIPVRRPLLEDLGVPNRSDSPRDRDVPRLTLVRSDPPQEDLKGSLRGNAGLLPILWRDETCAGRDALVGWLPGRAPESRSRPSLCIERNGSILAPAWTASGPSRRGAVDAAQSRFARWNFDSGDRLPVDLVVANEFEFRAERVGYWPKRIGIRDGVVEFDAAAWRNDGRETHLPILSLQRFEIRMDKADWSPPTADLKVWGDLTGCCRIRIHGAAGIDLDGRGGRTTPLDPPVELEYEARASIVAPVIEQGPFTETIERLRSALPRIFSTDQSIEGCRFLPRETRRLAAALAVNCVGILDCSRVLAFAFDAGGGVSRTLLLVITPEESGSTVHKLLAEAMSHESFVESLRRVSEDDRIHRSRRQPRQPRWESFKADPLDPSLAPLL